MKKILIVDDHAIARYGLIVNIQKRLQNVQIFECKGENAMLEMAKHNYDLIIMEAKISGNNSLWLMKVLLQHYPGNNILIFTDSDENVYSSRFLMAGAVGYISKSAPIEKIQTAVENVINNKRYMEAQLVNNTGYQQYQSGKVQRKGLSEKEFEIASLLLKGQRITFISKTKNLKVSTVSTHKARIFFKLGISNVLQLKEALYFVNPGTAFTGNSNNLQTAPIGYQYVNCLPI